jgi:hypothetical protein
MRFVSVVANERGSPVCINGLINKAVANAICSIVFGKRFEYDDEKFHNFVFAITETVIDSIDLLPNPKPLYKFNVKALCSFHGCAAANPVSGKLSYDHDRDNSSSSAVDRDFESYSRRAIDYEKGICWLSAKDIALSNKSSDWFVQNEDTVSILSDSSSWNCRDRDRMIIGFTTTCAISVYHH